MKKLMKRIIPLVLIVVMCVGTAAPAFAASASMSYVMSNNFPAQSTSSYSSTYTGLVQRYMCMYNSTTRAYVIDSGGIDGSFGTGTQNAVVAYQVAKKFTTDGVFGSQSWPSLASSLSASGTSGAVVYTYYSYIYGNSAAMIRITNVSSGYVQSTSYWYYNGSNGGDKGTDVSYNYLRYGISSATN